MKKFSYICFRVLVFIVRLFYPKFTVEGVENMPDEPSVYAGNHSQLHGPLTAEFYFPGKRRIWCNGEMMVLREVPDYTLKDFWGHKPKWQQPFFRVASYLIAPLSVCLFNNAKTIPVYHDRRIIKTFKETGKHLDDGANIIIFPEHEVEHNHIVYDFQSGFIDLARMYQKSAGKALHFVPMYVCPELRKVYIGKATRFDPEAEAVAERERIRVYLMEEITKIAESLPRHRVVPYPNLPKKKYKYNIEAE